MRHEHVPNVITVTRIVLTPILLGLLMTDALWARVGALMLFVLAAASDYVDGQLARSYGVRSRLGQFLDPFADKVLVLGTLVALSVLEPATVPWWAVGVIALRDVAVTGLRTWAEAQGRTLRTLPVAKAKTLLQLAFLFGMLMLLALSKTSGALQQSGRWMLDSSIPYLVLLILVGVTVLTGVLYLFQQEEKEVVPANMKR